jgi:hypothetical protein
MSSFLVYVITSSANGFITLKKKQSERRIKWIAHIHMPR